MKLSSRIRQSLWLEWVNQSLYFRVPWRRRRQIIQELRANLSESNQEVGADEAMKRLGSAKAIVDGYLEMDKERVDLSVALLATLLIPTLLTVVGGFITIIVSETRDVLAPEAPLDHTYLGLYEVSISGSAVSMSWSSSAVPVLMLIAFLIGGRFWRLIPRIRRRFSK